jgi:hypothetical protein
MVSSSNMLSNSNLIKLAIWEPQLLSLTQEAQEVLLLIYSVDIIDENNELFIYLCVISLSKI